MAFMILPDRKPNDRICFGIGTHTADCG